jgi:colanic acid/amylovoran biosynthesis glycosyltransferase
LEDIVKNVLIFAERMLPSTQTFIPLQVAALTRYKPHYAGLIPAERNYALADKPVLLNRDRSLISLIRRELYRWTGIAPGFQSQIRQIRPDIIHAHFAEGTSSALFLSRQLQVPFVLHLRGGAELLSDRELLQHAFQFPYLAFRRRLWKRASLFLCVSEYIRDKALLAGFPREKLRVQYTGMNCEAFTPRRPVSEKDPFLVLYVGRLVPYKGCDYLLRAMALVQREHPKARLVVIGDGEFRPELERLNQELAVGCEFMGEQTQERIRWWLERARVFCASSVTLSDGMSEAFGNVFSEAQSMGVPVVSFRHGGIPETMCDGVT